ncbi:MAG: TonB-dependent receptor [Bacteroidetes bacterium]|nr:TonB-dependent receptor [Bacteroidota bacterium]
MLALILTLLIHPSADSLKVFTAPNVVVSATRTGINPQDSPTKIVDLDVKEMADLGFSSISGILSSTAGLFVKDYGPSQLSTISTRGTGAEETLFMMDGVRLNSVQNGQVDLFLLPISQIGHIEIAEGGLSSLYGADAVGGVVNLKTASDTSPSIGVNLGAGSYGYQQSSINVNRKTGGMFVSAMIQQTRSVDNFDFNYTDGPVTFPMKRSGADYVCNNQLVNLTMPGKEGTTSVIVSNVSADRGTPGAVTGPYYVGTQREYDNDFLAVVNHKRRLGDLTLSASTGFTYGYLRYIDPPLVAGGFGIDSYFKMISVQPSVQLNYSSTAFEAAFGADAEGDRGASSEMDGIKERTRAGVFASGVINLHGPFASEVHISPSARADWYSDFGGTFNPKLGVNIRPVESLPINIRGSVGTSFRAPTFNELYYAGAGNPNIKPEKSISYDAGLVLQIPSPFAVEADADFYSTDITDGIVWQPAADGIWRPQNYQKILSRGIELSLQANYNNLAVLSANYSFGNSLDISDPGSSSYDKQLIYLPQEQASLVAAVSPGIMTFSTTIEYTGFRFVTPQNDEFLPQFTTVDAAAGVKVPVGHLVFSPLLSVKNIFNTNYQVVPQYPMPLRTFYLNLGIRYNQ